MKPIRFSISSLLCLLFPVPTPAVAFFSTTPEDLNEASKVLAGQLEPGLPPGKTMGVRDLTSLDRQKTLLSIRIQDLLTNALAAIEGRKYRLVERLRPAEEYTPGQQGAFTYFFLKGLMGDGDNNKDGLVDTLKAYGYACEKLDALGLEQNPQMGKKTAIRVTRVK